MFELRQEIHYRLSTFVCRKVFQANIVFKLQRKCQQPSNSAFSITTKDAFQNQMSTICVTRSIKTESLFKYFECPFWEIFIQNSCKALLEQSDLELLFSKGIYSEDRLFNPAHRIDWIRFMCQDKWHIVVRRFHKKRVFNDALYFCRRVLLHQIFA